MQFGIFTVALGFKSNLTRPGLGARGIRSLTFQEFNFESNPIDFFSILTRMRNDVGRIRCLTVDLPTEVRCGFGVA